MATVATERIRLHLGGTLPENGWRIVNAKDGPCVDYCQDAKCLAQFGTETVDEIYASHILEHFAYRLDNELTDALNEWHRVLVRGGQLHISVPDLEIVCRLFGERTAISDRQLLLRVIYGGQTDEFDLHKSGFTEDTLKAALVRFRRVERVQSFKFFPDTSAKILWNQPISLNVTATK